MTARVWKPGDKALVEVEVTWTDESTVQCSIAADDGYFLPINALRPLPAAGEAATEDWLADMSKHLTLAADQCCQCDDGHHEWSTPYGTDGDVRISRDDARRIARLLVGGVPGRSEAEIKAEALREAADAMRLAKEPGRRYLRDLRDRLDVDVASSPDVWLEQRAAWIAGTTGAGDDRG